MPWVSHCRIFSCNTINYKCKVETILMTMEYWLGKKCKRVEQTFDFFSMKKVPYTVLNTTRIMSFRKGRENLKSNTNDLAFCMYMWWYIQKDRQLFVAMEVKSNFLGMNTLGGTMMRMLVIVYHLRQIRLFDFPIKRVHKTHARIVFRFPNFSLFLCIFLFQLFHVFLIPVFHVC